MWELLSSRGCRPRLSQYPCSFIQQSTEHQPGTWGESQHWGDGSDQNTAPSLWSVRSSWGR